MKYFVKLLLTAFCVLHLPFNVATAFQKEKIAVLPFELKGNVYETKDLGEVVSEWFITALVKNGRFDVVERRLLGQVLEEQQMIDIGLVSQESAVKIGKMLGAKVIISGSIINFNDVIEVNARIIDVESASVVAAENVRCIDKSTLHDLVEEMAGKITGSFPLTGFIAKRTGSDVVITLGKSAGLRPGMIFMSYKEGDAVKHPKTQEVLSVKKIATGKIHITEVGQKISSGVVIEESFSGAIQDADLVKSLNPLTAASHSIVKSNVSAQPMYVENNSGKADRLLRAEEGCDENNSSACADTRAVQAAQSEKAVPGPVVDRKGTHVKYGDGSIVDTQLQLLWLSKIEGMMSWSEAMRHVEKVNQKGLHGHNDWRVPNKAELLRAAQFAKANPGFFTLDDAWYWSATQNGPLSAWLVNMGHAKVAWNDFDEFTRSEDFETPHAVRLVRTIKSP